MTFADLPNAYRESSYFQGFPIETLVHIPKDLNYFFETDTEEQNPSMAIMINEGIFVPNERGLSGKLKNLAN